MVNVRTATLHFTDRTILAPPRARQLRPLTQWSDWVAASDDPTARTLPYDANRFDSAKMALDAEAAHAAVPVAHCVDRHAVLFGL
jgi:hypothetical protein